ncbi:unnamed protein product [Bursaphelenchus xylophilus]|uniref:(pine wood nematode) hypothetical protein n=1 Tax=Bursaphelenchus xylophilus TaxID=6326 RepID=A0A1I7SVS8_BURXY|nr:unnamed protein product [Bursaphelenchus xylophilus]CAG9098208.1 unnamed protein product [Bursaphelenchus xylophilus]
MKMTMFRGFQTPSPPNYPMDRKIKKPLMEKHRRERMNKSLSHLKDKLIKHYPSETSKLEKADILEKTVFHVDRMEKMLETVQQSFNANMRQMEIRFFEFLALPSNGLSQEQLSRLKQQYQLFSKRPVHPPFPINFNVVCPNIFKSFPPLLMPMPIPIMQNMQAMANRALGKEASAKDPMSASTTSSAENTHPSSTSTTPPCSSQTQQEEEGENEEIDVVDNEWYSKRSDDSGISSSPEISRFQKSRSEDVWRPF